MGQRPGLCGVFHQAGCQLELPTMLQRTKQGKMLHRHPRLTPCPRIPRCRPAMEGVPHAVSALRNPTRPDEPVLGVRQRRCQALQPSAVALRALADGGALLGRPGPDAPPGQGLREARVRHPRRGCGWRRSGRAGAGAPGEALLPPAPLQALHRRPGRAGQDEGAAHRAGGRPAVRPSQHAAAGHRQVPAARPQGLHHRLDRRPHGLAGGRPLPPR